MCDYCKNLFENIKSVNYKDVPEFENLSEAEFNTIVKKIGKNSVKHSTSNCYEKENECSDLDKTLHYGLAYCCYCQRTKYDGHNSIQHNNGNNHNGNGRNGRNGRNGHNGRNNRNSRNGRNGRNNHHDHNDYHNHNNYNSSFNNNSPHDHSSIEYLKSLVKWDKSSHTVRVFGGTELILEIESIEITEIHPIIDALFKSNIIKNSTKKEYFKHFEKFYEEKKTVTIKLMSFDPQIFNKFVEDNFSEKHILSPKIKINPVDGTFMDHTKIDEKVLEFHASHAATGDNHWGGGWDGNGFVQEEQMVLQSVREFLLVASIKLRLLPSESLAYADLAKRAVLLTTENKFINIKSCYGRAGLENLSGNISEYYEARDEIPFYAMKKAIKSVEGINDITKKDLFDIYRRALPVYIASYALPMIQGQIQSANQILNVRDSDGGCGAYKHNVNAILFIQYMAFLFAQSYFAGSQTINFYYHRMGMVNRMEYGFLEIAKFITESISVEEIWDKLWDFHDNYSNLFSKHIPNSF